jgi:hypothetical protein
MRRIIMPIILGLALLGGCQNSEPETKKIDKEETEQNEQTKESAESATAFPYPNLLSESNDTFFLLVIGEQNEENPIEEDKKIGKSVNDILSLPTLEMAQKAYPDLHIENEPAYLLFNKSELVIQANNLKDLTTYLENNGPK